MILFQGQKISKNSISAVANISMPRPCVDSVTYNQTKFTSSQQPPQHAVYSLIQTFTLVKIYIYLSALRDSNQLNGSTQNHTLHMEPLDKVFTNWPASRSHLFTVDVETGVLRLLFNKCIVQCVWQAYNDGKTTFESPLTLVLEGIRSCRLNV